MEPVADRKGFDYLDAAAEPFEVSTYHLEAAIAPYMQFLLLLKKQTGGLSIICMSYYTSYNPIL